MKLINILIFFILIIGNSFASAEYFNEGLALYKNNEFDKAKFKFEQDIVFNPKSENLIFIYQKYLINKKKGILKKKFKHGYLT